MAGPRRRSAVDAFATAYPNIAGWVKDGWVEVGQTDYSRSFVRAVDEGGTIWEGREHYKAVDDALRALDRGIARWMRDNG